jgi:hypothetical protein
MEKVVLDGQGVRIGHLRHVVADARTREPRTLLVALTPEARAMVGALQTVAVPARFVWGVRRDQVTLDRSLEEIAGALPPAL